MILERARLRNHMKPHLRREPTLLSNLYMFEQINPETVEIAVVSFLTICCSTICWQNCYVCDDKSRLALATRDPQALQRAVQLQEI